MSAVQRVSVVLPTLNGAATLPALLATLGRELAAGRGLVEIVAIDSGSSDGTRGLLVEAGARVLDLEGAPFGHGSARNRAAAAATGDVLLFLTQDVEPVGDGWLPPLLEALDDSRVAGVFGRQVARGASPEEEFLAKVNYAGRPRRLTGDDLRTAFGPGTTLFSNAFGAVRRAVWEAIPFPDIVMSEDQAWARAALEAGYEIRYEPRAEVYHGHRFGFARVFQRNFDSGSSLQALGLARGAWRAGAAHLLRELRWIAAQHRRSAVPHAVVVEAVRLLGFQFGRLERRMPRPLARMLGEAPRP